MRAHGRRSPVVVVVTAVLGTAMVAWSVAALTAPSAPPLVFGIYPDGEVGTVGPKGETKAEDASLGLRALERLHAGGRPFVVRLYTPYDGPGANALRALESDLRRYISAGFRVEVVLTYRPADGDRDRAVAGYVGFVRRAVRDLGTRVVALQVTNEVNLGGGGDASDGSYPGALQALVRGVIAAKHEAMRTGADRLAIGFSWAHEGGAAAAAFWTRLGREGGRAFADAVDWVGLDVYPGTWSAAPATGETAASVRATMTGALRALRRTQLPRAGLGESVALRVTENGFPTSAARSAAAQAELLRAAVQAVDDVRGSLHVTDYRWFDLRDADSSNPSAESQYGLLRDDYSPKPAFATYAALIARLSRARS